MSKYSDIDWTKAGLAAGGGGLAGFLFNRYLLGNKSLKSDIIATLLGAGLTGGGSAAYDYFTAPEVMKDAEKADKTSRATSSAEQRLKDVDEKPLSKNRSRVVLGMMTPEQRAELEKRLKEDQDNPLYGPLMRVGVPAVAAPAASLAVTGGVNIAARKRDKNSGYKTYEKGNLDKVLPITEGTVPLDQMTRKQRNKLLLDIRSGEARIKESPVLDTIATEMADRSKARVADMNARDRAAAAKMSNETINRMQNVGYITEAEAKAMRNAAASNPPKLPIRRPHTKGEIIKRINRKAPRTFKRRFRGKAGAIANIASLLVGPISWLVERKRQQELTDFAKAVKGAGGSYESAAQL